MRTLTWVLCVLLLCTVIWSSAQSPHGTALQIDCASCHTSDSWAVNTDSISFDHDVTRFPLTGQHQVIDCRQCHTSLEFDRAEMECASCHLDMHEGSVGMDCARCHNSASWLVNNIAELHRRASFPLLGAHEQADCVDCHTSASNLRFDPMNQDCIGCHQTDFASTTNPNHQGAGFSTNCIECHRFDAFNWDAEDINHDFFPLTLGHDIDDCAQCHKVADYTKTSPQCLACHEQDFLATTNPNHPAAMFSTDCASCHTTDPGWQPASFADHDLQYFPIYSGSHQGTWADCKACHTNEQNFAEFTCITCHAQETTSDQHTGIAGYSYTSTACLACHPTGEADGSFDHNQTNFPLTGAHIGVECISCHANGYAGTPTNCFACHNEDFTATVNPSHPALGLSNDCVSCHTTDPDWEPAQFDIHNDFYVLQGAHAVIANQCALCHQGDYNNTPTTCAGCHMMDYTATTNPPHAATGFSTDCATCHSVNAWTPSIFDHDALYFPIYSGSHEGVWSECIECHTTPGNFQDYTCVTCHGPTETADQHQGVTGYTHSSTACLACHPTGEADGAFDHNQTAFPLTGAHVTVDCAMCHANGYTGTPTDCQACHLDNFTASINPNHIAIGFSTDCASCHTTEPGWSPASFINHNDYYPLNGAHAVIANQCATCHQGDYNNTPNTCFGCHQPDYTQTTDPPHVTLQFSQDCATCHSESAWEPSTFDHDNQFFPIYSGSHMGVWSQCSECHTTPGDYNIFTCVTCHTVDETGQDHAGVNGYVYNSLACFGCHPNGEGDSGFDHNNTAFPLTGAHTTVNCQECHVSGYAGTPTACAFCHTTDYQQSINPSHTSLGLSMDCASCHTTEPGWSPASFIVHDQYYPLIGAHAPIANQCAACHNGDYVNTPNTCAGCHQPDYNQATNPNHTALGLPVDCAMCHAQTDWTPASFPNHNDYYVLNGAHAAIANDCVQCHQGDYSNTPNTCAGCHIEDYNQTLDPNHLQAGFGTDCASCHNENAWEPATFDHDAQYFPIYSGDHLGVWSQCSECHTDPGNYSVYTCVTCHMNPETDQEHAGVNGYVYNSTYCLACHPTGSADNAFDHNATNFPLTGSHLGVDCNQCHANGFEGTPTECNACHAIDYNQSVNPNHGNLGLSIDCASCHTTAPDWEPASFAIHNQYYPLNGAHAAIANQCATCHNGDYNNTPNTCVGCHLDNYNQTDNPPHDVLNFSTDCASCHSESAWSPASYEEHDNQYFPIYSGDHQGVWGACNDCHTSPNNYSVYSCVICHTNPETNQQHAGVNGYIYENDACLACHPTGSADNAFDHDQSDFPLTGAHLVVDCIDCHASGYEGTPTNCDACHLQDHNQSSNPNHVALSIPTNCVSCHTTAPDWNPALFPIHNDYYPLVGAHAAIANQCVLCHNGNYNNTPNTCVGCHLTDYNQTNDPDHQAAQFPTTCESCHTQSAWVPANWDHDDLYFPIYDGEHEDEWNTCTDCHTNPSNYNIFTCLPCHPSGEMADEHDEVGGYQYNSAACYACHPDGED
jgi:hypothetical protein